ncbi:MAG: hypothetical protein LWX56_11930 [Ignavibacteria bacterium]|nr:hypothetical protein [Ignavibacteria bacterium]
MKSETSESYKSFLSLYPTLCDQHIRDLYLNNSIYSSAAPGISVSYINNASNRIIQSTLSFNYGSINWGMGSPNASLINASISFAYLPRIAELHIAFIPLHCNLGGKIQSFSSNTDVKTNSQIDWYGVADRSWYLANTIELCLHLEAEFSSASCLETDISVPVYCLYSRPEAGHHFSQYNREVMDNFLNEFTHMHSLFIGEMFSVSSSCLYKYTINPTTEFLSGAEFTYYTAENPRPLQSYYLKYIIGFRFGI